MHGARELQAIHRAAGCSPGFAGRQAVRLLQPNPALRRFFRRRDLTGVMLSRAGELPEKPGRLRGFRRHKYEPAGHTPRRYTDPEGEETPPK